MESTTQQVIDSAMQLSASDRIIVLSALKQSLDDTEIDHGPTEPADEVESAWDTEIAKRIEDIDSGRVKTIPWDEAWKRINGDESASI